MNVFRRLSLLLLPAFAAILLLGCYTDNKVKLKIIHAGSVSVPIHEIVDSFRALHPDIVIETEAWGSKAGARRVADLNQSCDVFVSADDKVIRDILIPEHASWSISFAGNEMALVYTSKSKYSGEINNQNWIEILLRNDVVYSRSDPDSDPCGSRAVLCMKLAEKHYKQQGLAEKLLSRHTQHIRPKETDLIALLEKNVIDYIFLYKSVAMQHGLLFVELPDEVNLRKPALDSLYGEVWVEVAGKTPQQRVIEYGSAMVYGVTIPKSSQNTNLAEEFVAFFLDPDKGQKIFEKHGQHSLVPSPSIYYENIPKQLQKFATDTK